MRIASFNLENLFDRAKALNQETWDEGRPTLERFRELATLLEEPVYDSATKARISRLIVELGMEKSDTGPFVIIRRNRGHLVKRKKTGEIEIVANGRNDWIGWVELRTEPVNEKAIVNTGRVIGDVNADVIALVEAENRIALKEFNEDIIPLGGGTPYEQIMLIDGNDERGIDVGLMTRSGFKINLMRSHVHDGNADYPVIFSRDCPEFQVIGPNGTEIWFLVNHLKSKGYGSPAENDRKRKAQATRVAEIYRELRNRGIANVVVLGDMNDTPARDPLSPIIDETDLKDVFEHPEFDDGGHPGTYAGATKSTKIDYIFLSPALFANVVSGGVFRRGAWPGVRPKKWEVYDTITKPVHAASDHHAVWVDINLQAIV